MLCWYFIILLYVKISRSTLTYCGLSDGTRCPVNAQPDCIDRIYCQTPPYNPICSQALPPCPTEPQVSSDPSAHAFPQAVTPPTLSPTLPPIATTTKKSGGFDVGPVSIFVPKGGPVESPELHFPSIMNAPVSPITINENDPLKLMCSAEEPSTRVVWVRAKDNKTVAEGNEFVIDKIQPKDAGGYYCVAQNLENAVALVRTNITVHCAPRIPNGNQHTVLEAKSGDNITLRCDTKCTPEPYYVWYQHNKGILKTCEPFPSNVEEEAEPGEKYSYCDLTVTAKAQGKWTCVKTNDLGKETQTYEIKPKFTVPPEPTIPPPPPAINIVKPKRRCEDFEVVGCHTSCATIPYLPKLLFVDTGLTEEYGDTLSAYTKQLVRRCATEACIGGYNYFGIASYDQCYAGNNQPTTGVQNLGKLQECVNDQLKPCSPKDMFCVGQCCSMFVYKIKGLRSRAATDTAGHTESRFKRGFNRRNTCSPFKRYLEKIIRNQNRMENIDS